MAIDKGLSFRVEATPHEGTGSKGLFSLKIKVKKKQDAGTQYDTILKIKKSSSNKTIHLVNSEQTMTSFDMLVEKPREKRTKKTKSFFGPFKPGGCLDPPLDDDKYVYAPAGETKSSSSLDSKQKGRKKIETKITEIRIESDTHLIDKSSSASVLSLFKEVHTTSLNAPSSNTIITYPTDVKNSKVSTSSSEKKRFDDNRKRSFVQTSEYYFKPKNDENAPKSQYIVSKPKNSRKAHKSIDSDKALTHVQELPRRINQEPIEDEQTVPIHPDIANLPATEASSSIQDVPIQEQPFAGRILDLACDSEFLKPDTEVVPAEEAITKTLTIQPELKTSQDLELSNLQVQEPKTTVKQVEQETINAFKTEQIHKKTSSVDQINSETDGNIQETKASFDQVRQRTSNAFDTEQIQTQISLVDQVNAKTAKEKSQDNLPERLQLEIPQDKAFSKKQFEELQTLVQDKVNILPIPAIDFDREEIASQQSHSIKANYPMQNEAAYDTTNGLEIVILEDKTAAAEDKSSARQQASKENTAQCVQITAASHKTSKEDLLQFVIAGEDKLNLKGPDKLNSETQEQNKKIQVSDKTEIDNAENLDTNFQEIKAKYENTMDNNNAKSLINEAIQGNMTLPTKDKTVKPGEVENDVQGFDNISTHATELVTDILGLYEKTTSASGQEDLVNLDIMFENKKSPRQEHSDSMTSTAELANGLASASGTSADPTRDGNVMNKIVIQRKPNTTKAVSITSSKKDLFKSSEVVSESRVSSKSQILKNSSRDLSVSMSLNKSIPESRGSCKAQIVRSNGDRKASAQNVISSVFPLHKSTSSHTSKHNVFSANQQPSDSGIADFRDILPSEKLNSDNEDIKYKDFTDISIMLPLSEIKSQLEENISLSQIDDVLEKRMAHLISPVISIRQIAEEGVLAYEAELQRESKNNIVLPEKKASETISILEKKSLKISTGKATYIPTDEEQVDEAGIRKIDQRSSQILDSPERASLQSRGVDKGNTITEEKTSQITASSQKQTSQISTHPSDTEIVSLANKDEIQKMEAKSSLVVFLADKLSAPLPLPREMSSQSTRRTMDKESQISLEPAITRMISDSLIKKKEYIEEQDDGLKEEIFSIKANGGKVYPEAKSQIVKHISHELIISDKQEAESYGPGVREKTSNTRVPEDKLISKQGSKICVTQTSQTKNLFLKGDLAPEASQKSVLRGAEMRSRDLTPTPVAPSIEIYPTDQFLVDIAFDVSRNGPAKQTTIKTVDVESASNRLLERQNIILHKSIVQKPFDAAINIPINPEYDISLKLNKKVKQKPVKRAEKKLSKISLDRKTKHKVIKHIDINARKEVDINKVLEIIYKEQLQPLEMNIKQLKGEILLMSHEQAFIQQKVMNLADRRPSSRPNKVKRNYSCLCKKKF